MSSLVILIEYSTRRSIDSCFFWLFQDRTGECRSWDNRSDREFLECSCRVVDKMLYVSIECGYVSILSGIVF